MITATPGVTLAALPVGEMRDKESPVDHHSTIRLATPARNPLAYPGDAPARSWILAGTRLQWLAHEEEVEPALQGRIPVIAIGSNRRPGRLAAHLQSPEPVAGLRTILRGADIVYPSHVASYGVVTATIVPAEAQIRVWLLLLSEEQLLTLSKGEHLGELFDLFRLSGTIASSPHLRRPVDAPLAFVHRHGPMPFLDGEPRRLWRVPAIDTPLRRASLAQAHRNAARLLGNPTMAWPVAPADTPEVDRRLAALGSSIDWPSQDRLNNGSVVQRASLKSAPLRWAEPVVPAYAAPITANPRRRRLSASTISAVAARHSSPGGDTPTERSR